LLKAYKEAHQNDDIKKGDLQGIRVYKYKVGNNLILLGTGAK